MRTIILLAIPFILFASGEQIRPSDHQFLHGSNYRPSIKLERKMMLNRLSKIDKSQAEALVNKLTGEESISLRLKHQGKYLIYKITTEDHYLVINALDGTVIKQELKEGK